MRVYLDAMLNRGIICLDAYAIQACTRNRLSQFTVAHAKGEGRAIVGVERAVHSLARRCDLQTCDTFLLLFHSGPDIRIKELHWGIQAFRNAVGGLGCEDSLLNVGHLPTRGDEFAVSLLAGFPMKAHPNPFA
jgi:cell division GTPase FtsZ